MEGMPKNRQSFGNAAELRRRFSMLNMREEADQQNDNLLEPELPKTVKSLRRKSTMMITEPSTQNEDSLMITRKDSLIATKSQKEER